MITPAASLLVHALVRPYGVLSSTQSRGTVPRLPRTLPAPGKLRRYQPLAQVTDRRQQPGRGRRQQTGQTLDQCQPAPDPLQIPACLSDNRVPHSVPIARS